MQEIGQIYMSAGGMFGPYFPVSRREDKKIQLKTNGSIKK